MRGSAGRGHRTKDIRGEDCSSCGKGVARVAFFKARNRFFFGCSASTKEAPCRGSREWQSVDVPEELRKIPDAPPLPDAVKPDPERDRKRPVSEVRQTGESSSGDESERAEVKYIKEELN
jgi:hypothetical protein